MPFDVRRIANAILSMAERRGNLLTNMSVNKLTYFSHGWHLALFGEPLVDSPFEAWQYGPVHPTLYKQFKAYGAGEITGRATKVDPHTGADIPVDIVVPADVEEHLERVVGFYGHLKAEELSKISHKQGAPWDLIWGKRESVPGMKIPDELTREYYIGMLRRPN